MEVVLRPDGHHPGAGPGPQPAPRRRHDRRCRGLLPRPAGGTRRQRRLLGPGQGVDQRPRPRVEGRLPHGHHRQPDADEL